ncbi:MAG TPA: hypothetical protein PKK23_05270 [Nitrospirales bacterium]|nr:hypothetical protein [Nitrospiraceae bacterium]HNP28431.1 hypothetical protein [Nitrospirales bacterium]
MIKFSHLLGLPLLLLIWTYPAASEPYSPSCGIAVEKVIKARKNLLAYQQTLQVTRNRERVAYSDVAVCAGGGTFSAGRAIACNHASWKAPTQTKEVIEAEENYLQARKKFEKSFEYAGESCLFTP